MNWPLNDGFVSGIPACKISPPASCLWELKCSVTLSHFHSCKLSN
jgi:hypothetical protein